MRFKGKYIVRHFRAGQQIGLHRINNAICDAGLYEIIDVMFRAQTQKSTWYMGLIDNAGFLGVDDSDTSGSHSGWTELSDYDELGRPEWAATFLSAPAVFINSPQAEFTMNATKNIQGCFISSSLTKGSSSGILWSTALFTSPIPVVSADVFKCQYQLTADRG